MWLRWVTDKFQLKGVSSTDFAFDGRVLCGLNKEQFLEKSAAAGNILWVHLEMQMQKGMIEPLKWQSPSLYLPWH
ncbi:MAG: hypothetical protein GY696_39975, partial [Gammaproteobacteria bacterium]|nr:hypothetical protein [Gammaproteobacteria bacterium]